MHPLVIIAWIIGINIGWWAMDRFINWLDRPKPMRNITPPQE